MFQVNEPIKLEGAHNVRELGGYATEDGRVTKSGIFLRGDGTQYLTERDIKILEDAGVSLIVDMRSPDEVKSYPSRFSTLAHFRYENVVMFDGLQYLLNQDVVPNSMADLYCRLLDGCQEQYGRIFRYFHDNDGVSLFHCTAGKDRTGVVAMLLLRLAGVPEPMIIADYAVSESNMLCVFERQNQQLKEAGISVPEFIFGSRAEDMEETLDYFNRKYNNAEQYLKRCGLTQHEINFIKNRFIL